MPNIWLYQGALNPTTIILSDPTKPRSSAVIVAIAAALFGMSSLSALGLESQIARVKTAAQAASTLVQAIPSTPEIAEALVPVQFAISAAAVRLANLVLNPSLPIGQKVALTVAIVGSVDAIQAAIVLAQQSWQAAWRTRDLVAEENAALVIGQLSQQLIILQGSLRTGNSTSIN